MGKYLGTIIRYSNNFSAQFHIMRDFPTHNVLMLAGLWGADNYVNLRLAAQLREDMFTYLASLPTAEAQSKLSDQWALWEVVWPVAR